MLRHDHMRLARHGCCVGYWDQRLHKTSYRHAKPAASFFLGGSKCTSICCLVVGGVQPTFLHILTYTVSFLALYNPLLPRTFWRVIFGVCFWGGLSQPLTNLEHLIFASGIAVILKGRESLGNCEDSGREDWGTLGNIRED